VVVDGGEKDQALRRRGLAVFSQAADVSAVAERSGRDAGGAGPRHKAVEEAMGLHLTEAPAAVADEDGGGLSQYAQSNARLQEAVLQGLKVLEDTNDAVRIVSGEVGADQTAGDDGGLVGRNTASNKQIVGEALDNGGGEGRHGRVALETRDNHDTGLTIGTGAADE
jgi:hypothetical protein